MRQRMVMTGSQLGLKALLLVFVLTSAIKASAQSRITDKQLTYISKQLKETPLLEDKDDDFKDDNSSRWKDESAVILCQKTTFAFDKKGLSVGKRIGRNIGALLFAPFTFGTSLYFANARNETSILVEERERRRLQLNDKFSIEQYSILYFRMYADGDEFAAKVIKKDGSEEAVDLSEAVQVSDLKTVPSIFRTYTDRGFSAYYRPAYYKIAVPNLEEGDVIEYELRNINTSSYINNPQYKEFEPIYYLCNRSLPVKKQVIEVATEDEKYFIGFKSMKGAPDFTETTNKDGKVYRWEDHDRDKMTDTRYVNEFITMPLIKFQVIYARNASKSFVWFDNAEDMKRDMTKEELTEKARIFWFHPEKLKATGGYMAGLGGDVSSTVKEMYKTLRRKGITQGSDEEFLRKSYYYIRSQTLYNGWSDFAFAKVFAGLLDERKIPYQVVVTTPNTRADLTNIAFTQELDWIIKSGDAYYCNPYEHHNPGDVPVYLAGNTAIVFGKEDAAALTEVLPLSDTLKNVMTCQIATELTGASLSDLKMEKRMEVSGLLKDDYTDDILALTPFMETDYRNYDGLGMWEGLSSHAEQEALTAFSDQKKEWKEEKPKMMKAIAESEYGVEVKDYERFNLMDDGRAYKKQHLKYSEKLTLGDMTSAAGNDLLFSLPALIGQQVQIKDDERTRTLPVDVRYPRNLVWDIRFSIPDGYEVKGLTNLENNVRTPYGAFISHAEVEGNVLKIKVQKIYAEKTLEAAQWPGLLQVLEAAYKFSQSRIVLKKV